MKKTFVWAHRGASGYAPENTLPAFKRAIEMGADGVELDVQMTKDGKLVIAHDETIERVSDGKGWIKDYNFEELRSFNFNKKYPELGKLYIPTLEEVYSLLKNTKMTVNVELKNGIIFYEGLEEKVILETEKAGFKERVIYSSFNHYSVMKLKKLDPQARTGFLYQDGYMNMPEYAEKNQVEALHPALYNVLYPNFIRDCKERGIAVRVWTVNKEVYMNMLCENEIDAIITNYPDIARRVVDEYAAKK